MVAQGKMTISLKSYIPSMVDQGPHPMMDQDASTSQHLTFLAMVRDPGKGIAMFMQHHQQRYCKSKLQKNH
jgi:hypothetical protein